MNDIHHYLAFSHFLGIGPVKFDLLIAHFNHVKKAYEASQKDLQFVLGPKLCADFVEFRGRFDPIKKLDEIEKKNIIPVARNDSRYPESLRALEDAPIMIYVRGDLGTIAFETDTFFGIVGTRKPTAYGEHVTKKFAEELATCGFVIVSGMALGVDTLAHLGALEGGGHTVAVLGCGVDIIYPPSNKDLYEKIVAGGGIVISEFPPGMTVLPGLFVARNRLISGLSRGVLVVEGLKESGGLITARYAGQQGKDVFAPPGPISSPMSYAPNMLLKEGAKMVTSVQDILEEFHLAVTPARQKSIAADLSVSEKLIVELLLHESRLPDEIAKKTQLNASEVSQCLSLLEIKGVIEKNKEGKYQMV